MGSIRIEGKPAGELPREIYNLRRPADSPCQALCHAPDHVLDIRADGRAAPCPYSRAKLGDLRKQTPQEVWKGEALQDLRRRFRDYRVRRSECGHCISYWEADLLAESPAVQEFDADAPEQPGPAPRRLRWHINARLSTAAREGLRAWFGQLEVLQLVIGPRSPKASWVRVLQELAERSARERPRVELHAENVFPDPAEVRGRVNAVHVHLSAARALPGDYPRCAALAAQLTEDEVPLTLHLPVDRLRWLNVWSWQRVAREHHFTLQPEAVSADHKDSCAGLDVASLATLHSILFRWTQELPDHGDSWTPLLQRLRGWQREAEVVVERPRWQLPELGHPLLEDEEEALRLLQDLLRTYRSETVRAWLNRLTGARNFVAAARESLPLRLLALWRACVFDDEPLYQLLREIYGSRAEAPEVVLRDQRAVQGTAWEGWLKSWLDKLGLERIGRQRRAFPHAAARKTRRPARPPVTVLIPSYNHEEYITAAIESVLGQSHTAFHLLVADDASSDGTVAAARACKDPRIQVSEARKNRGLGASMLAALKKVTTPYVAILNSDDLFHPDRLKLCLESVKKRQDVAVVATDFTTINADGRICSTDDSSPVFDGLQAFRWLQWQSGFRWPRQRNPDWWGLLLQRNFLVTSSNVFARRDFLLRHAPLWKGLEFCLDWQVFLLAALEGKLVCRRDKALGYRLHDSNTVWFEGERQWRYYVEANLVVAQSLEQLQKNQKGKPAALLADLVAAFSQHLRQNTSVDGLGVLLGRHLHQARLTPRDLTADDVRGHLAELDRSHRERVQAQNLFTQHREELPELLRLSGERDLLEGARVAHEVVLHELHQAEGELMGALHDRANLESLWHQAEAERDHEIAGKAELHQDLDQLRARADELEQAQTDLRQQLGEKEQQLQDRDQQVEEGRRQGEEMRAELERQNQELSRQQTELRQRQEELAREVEKLRQRDQELDHTREQLDARTEERDTLQHSAEYRAGSLLLNKAGMRRPLQLAERSLMELRQRATMARFGLEGRLPRGARRPYRAMATICWNFPIYSQTFVYQELTQLMQRGFDLRIVYSHQEPRAHLHRQFDHLWKTRRRMLLHRQLHQRDVEYYRRRMPAKVAQLTELIARHSGLPVPHVQAHDNYQQAFTYARMAERYRPDYLHSYFFYDRSLFSLVAGYLLDIPRGVSCYADHVMDDYEFKLVPLHMELCDVVIATSARIKRELLERAPDADPDKILVKPNAVDSQRFPIIERQEPANGDPYRVVTVSRIEPKKGLLTMVDAAKLLRDRGFPVEFHVVGEADAGIQSSLDYRARLLESIERHNLWGTVHLEGRQELDGVRRFLQMSQLFVAPFVETESGDKDGIPTALLEGMATGLPALATDAGSITEVIDSGVDGEIVAQRDPEALADTLVRMLQDPAGREAMARKAAEKVRKEFDVSVCERRFHDRVLELISARRRPG